jgi:hypothetical protein
MGYPARPRAFFPNGSPPGELEGKAAGAPAQAVAVGDAPEAPKRPEVGRVPDAAIAHSVDQDHRCAGSALDRVAGSTFFCKPAMR